MLKKKRFFEFPVKKSSIIAYIGIVIELEISVCNVFVEFGSAAYICICKYF